MSTASIPELRKAQTRARARLARAAVNWQPRQQPWAGVAGANPDPRSGLWWAAFRLDGARAAGDPVMTVEAVRALREAAIAVWERGLNRGAPAERGG